MPNTLPNQNPLSYFGVKAETPPNLIQAMRDPRLTDKGNQYPIGTIWINKSSGTAFQLTQYIAGVPSWEVMSGNNGYPITPYVVGTIGQAGYQTIQSAINAAHAAGGNGYIFVQPGTYNENLTFYDGITINGTIVLSGFADTVGVFINGVHTPPLHGGISFNYVDLSSTTDIFFSAAAGDCQINISNAAVITDNGYTFNLPNWTGILGTFNINCVGTALQNNGMIVNYGGSQFACFESGFGWGTALTMHTSGDVFLGQCESRPPWVFENGSTIDAYNHEFQAQVTFSGNTAGLIKRCHFLASGTPAITMNSSGNIVFASGFIDCDTDPVINGNGVGTLSLSGISFVNKSAIANTVTTSAGIIRGGNFISQFIVGKSPDAHFQTIQSALDAANTAGGGAVYVQPGVYTENLTCYDATQIIAATGFSDQGGLGSVRIIGVHTPPASGGFTFRSVSLESATDIFASNVAGTAHILITDSIVKVTNGFAYNLPNWTGIFESWNVNCSNGTNDGFVNNTGGATVLAFECGLGAGSAKTAVISGDVLIETSEINCPVNLVTGANAIINWAELANPLSFLNNSVAELSFCRLSTGASSSIIQSSTGAINLSNCSVNSSAVPVIDGAGAGVLTLASITYLSGHALAGTLTLSTSSEFSVSGSVLANTVLRSAGDVAGVASTVSICNVTDEALGAGAGTVLMKTGNPGNSSGWLKIYNGTNVRYVPYWTNISP